MDDVVQMCALLVPNVSG